MTDPKHITPGAPEDLHKPVDGDTEGGACLSGHSSEHSDRTSCTYRWQALHPAAGERHPVYARLPKVSASAQRAFAKAGVPKGFLPTSRYVSKRGNPVPLNYAFQIALPEHQDDWRVGGPTRPNFISASGKPIPPGANFTKNTWPYWNNAHHIIPKGLLNRLINKITDPECRDLVRTGLLRAKYNVNHWINVVILPMDFEVARHLSLPRHLALEDETAVFEPNPKFDHKAYARKVKRLLEKIMDGYRSAVAAAVAGKDCSSGRTVSLSKDRLEEVSRLCYALIVSLGQTKPGASIGEIDLPE
jgi:hypothetical protein